MASLLSLFRDPNSTERAQRWLREQLVRCPLIVLGVANYCKSHAVSYPSSGPLKDILGSILVGRGAFGSLVTLGRPWPDVMRDQHAAICVRPAGCDALCANSRPCDGFDGVVFTSIHVYTTLSRA